MRLALAALLIAAALGSAQAACVRIGYGPVIVCESPAPSGLCRARLQGRAPLPPTWMQAADGTPFRMLACGRQS